MTKIIALIRWAIAFEIAQYRSLFRWVTRRPDVPSGAVPFAYVGAVSALLWVFIFGSAIELVALHIFIPWETVRLVVDILSLWSLVWMLGFLASFKVHPHLVTEAGLRIRNSFGTDVAVSWDDVETVLTRERTPEKARTLHLERDEQETILSVTIAGRTNVDVKLRRPLAVPLRKGPESVTELRFYVDEPRPLLAEVLAHRAPRS